jgi:hypothetical protein
MKIDKDLEKDIDEAVKAVEAVEILNLVFKNEKIESTIDQINTDLAAYGFDNALKIKVGIDKVISHMNRNIGAFWQHSSRLCRVSALYILLTTRNKEYAKKYRGESPDDKHAFILKIVKFVLVL